MVVILICDAARNGGHGKQPKETNIIDMKKKNMRVGKVIRIFSAKSENLGHK